MDAYVKAFWLPKDGSSEEEYEDAFFPRHSSSLTGERLRFAVADGATEASFSRLWARMLVRAFVRRSLDLPLTLEQLAPLRELWSASIHDKPLPWYAEEKAASGAFSSLLGLELAEERPEGNVKRTWRAVAAGDTCLVQVTGDRLVRTFPLNESAQFNNTPNLLGSLPGGPPLHGGFDDGIQRDKTVGTTEGSEPLEPGGESASRGPSDQSGKFDDSSLVLECTGNWAPEDQFLLMTDALACWFLKEFERGRKPWSIFKEAEANDEASFRELIVKLRSEGAIKNDDVTLMKIEL